MASPRDTNLLQTNKLFLDVITALISLSESSIVPPRVIPFVARLKSPLLYVVRVPRRQRVFQE